MQPVPAAPLVGRRPAGARRLLAGLALLGAAAAAALGAHALAGSSVRTAAVQATARPAASGGLIGGVPLQQARCAQWNAGTATERSRVLAALGFVVGGPTEHGGNGTTLTSGQATQLFDNECASPIARHFLLYELYTRAAAFRVLASR